jgi:pyruvate formate lyase activating enzyme
MIIGGLEKFSLIDYPEHLSAIVFTQGCNFRCHFCYNPMLVVPLSPLSSNNREDNELEVDKLENTAFEAGRKKSYPLISEDSLFLFLNSRVGKLDGVVISGGEPTMQKDLPEFAAKIKALGFKVKLDTNGTNPEMLKRMLSDDSLDYIAMDIKAPLGKYAKIVNIEADLKKIRESINIIIGSGKPYEFRTTIVPGLHETADILEMGKAIKGARKWYLQKFEGETPLVNNNLYGRQNFSDAEFQKMAEVGRQYVEFCDFR